MSGILFPASLFSALVPAAVGGQSVAVGPVATWRIDPEPIVSVGDGAGRGHDLHIVRDATRLPDGRLAVLDHGSSQVRIFRLDGSLDRTLGRPGEGPGEFEGPHAFRLIADDVLAVYDRVLARLTVMALDGDVLETRPILYAIEAGGIDGGRRRPMTSGLVPFVRSDLPLFEGVRRDAGLHEHDSLVFSVHDGTALRPLFKRTMFPRYQAKDGSTSITREPPFGPSVVWAVGTAEFVIGSSHERRFAGFASDGRPTRIWTAEGMSRRPTSDDWDDFRRNFLEESTLRIRGQTMSTGRSREIFVEEAPRGDRVPLWDTAYLADDGLLWLRRYHLRGADAEWQVVSPDRGPVARIALPADAVLFEAGADYVILRERDEWDVERVRMYRLVR